MSQTKCSEITLIANWSLDHQDISSYFSKITRSCLIQSSKLRSFELRRVAVCWRSRLVQVCLVASAFTAWHPTFQQPGRPTTQDAAASRLLEAARERGEESEFEFLSVDLDACKNVEIEKHAPKWLNQVLHSPSRSHIEIHWIGLHQNHHRITLHF